MLQFFNQGGIFMYVILAISVIALAIILERFAMLHFAYAYKEGFFQQVLKYAKKGQFVRAQDMCGSTRHPLAIILQEMFRHRDDDMESLTSAASIGFQHIMPKLQNRTNYVAMFGNIATLVGLLGTIQGLIVSFTSLSGASAAQKAQLLATGISTAMNTTAFGLIVAIPCIVAYTILNNKQNALIDQYEETISTALHIMEHQYKGHMRANNTYDSMESLKIAM